jgi:hypothetical protein
MVVINPKGLFSGDRIARLSDQAKLYWPWFFLSSNGFARIEINYRKFKTEVLGGFDHPMTEQEYLSLIKEYGNQLLFLYRSSTGQVWGQWDTSLKWCPRHHTREDHRSPTPNHADFTKWKDNSLKSTQAPLLSAFSEIFGTLPQSSAVGTGANDTAYRDIFGSNTQVPLPSTISEISQKFSEIPASSCSCSCRRERREVSTGETEAKLHHEPSCSLFEPQKSIRNPSTVLEPEWFDFKKSWESSCVQATDDQWSEALLVWRMLDHDQKNRAHAFIAEAAASDYYKVTHTSPAKYLRLKINGKPIWENPIPETKKAPQQASKAQSSRLPTADEITKQQEAHAREWLERHNTPEAIAKRAAEDAEIERRKAARMARQAQSGVIAHAS